MEKTKAKEIVKKIFSNFTDAQREAWKRTASGMPLLEGETYHIKPIGEDADKNVTGCLEGKIGAGAPNAGQVFKQFDTVEGTPIGFAQVARLNNGLELEGATREDLVADLICKIDDYMTKNKEAKGMPVKVKSLKTRPGQNGQMVIPTFELA